jgi:hypothetical protein
LSRTSGTNNHGGVYRELLVARRVAVVFVDNPTEPDPLHVSSMTLGKDQAFT